MQYNLGGPDGIIDPFVDGGAGLASMLNDWRDALYTMQRGPTRPAFAVPGMFWVSDAGGPSAWIVNLYVSPTIGDVAILSIDTTTGDVLFNPDNLGGPYLGTGGGDITGPLTVPRLNIAAGAAPTLLLRATGNAPNLKSWRTFLDAAGAVALQRMNDAETAPIAGAAVTIHADATIDAASPAPGALAKELVTAEWVRAIAAGLSTPAGIVAPFAGLVAPSGWLFANAQTVSRTTYAALFAAIGTAYNTGGEAGTDFRLPDLRGRAPFGADTMGGSAAAGRLGTGPAGGITGPANVAAAGGTQGHQLTAAQQADMTLTATGGAVAGTVNAGAGASGYPTIPFDGADPALGYGPQNILYIASLAGKANGGGTTGGAHNNLPPALVLNYIIKT